MRELTRAQLSLVLRIAAIGCVAMRALGSFLWVNGFDEADGGDLVHYLLTTLPLNVGLAAVLYVVGVLLGRPDPLPPTPPAAAAPAAEASVLDLDAPINLAVFQPPTTSQAPTSPIPIGDPHAAFRRE